MMSKAQEGIDKAYAETEKLRREIEAQIVANKAKKNKACPHTTVCPNEQGTAWCY